MVFWSCGVVGVLGGSDYGSFFFLGVVEDGFNVFVVVLVGVLVWVVEGFVDGVDVELFEEGCVGCLCGEYFGVL